jgi:hypothetical protein
MKAPLLHLIALTLAWSFPTHAGLAQDSRKSESATAQPLNIVILYADDWRHNTLGCAGNPVVKTPQLDRLAGQGLRFTDAFECDVSTEAEANEGNFGIGV